MSKINIIREQILLTKKKTDHLISNFTEDQWIETPDIINTNLNWQIGHIILANYLHGVASITGSSLELKKQINLSEYLKFYGQKSNPGDYLSEKPSSEKLLEIYELIFSMIDEGFKILQPQDLQNKTEIPNPAANTKNEALFWLPQHQSWHNGQIAIIKRIIV